MPVIRFPALALAALICAPTLWPLAGQSTADRDAIEKVVLTRLRGFTGFKEHTFLLDSRSPTGPNGPPRTATESGILAAVAEFQLASPQVLDTCQGSLAARACSGLPTATVLVAVGAPTFESQSLAKIELHTLVAGDTPTRYLMTMERKDGQWVVAQTRVTEIIPARPKGTGSQH